MKKSMFLLLLMCFFGERGFSQVEIRGVTTIVTDGIQSDTVNLSPNKEFEKRINLEPIDKSGNEVEIRFYKHEQLSNTKDLKVLKLNGDSWTGAEYKELVYPKIKIEKFDLVAQNGFEKLFITLLQNNLTRLPSQKELEPKMKKYVDTIRGRAEQKIITTDGQTYTVEFKIGETYRVYTFHNPDTYSNFYNEVQELKDFVAIKNIFETELKKK